MSNELALDIRLINLEIKDMITKIKQIGDEHLCDKQRIRQINYEDDDSDSEEETLEAIKERLDQQLSDLKAMYQIAQASFKEQKFNTIPTKEDNEAFKQGITREIHSYISDLKSENRY